MDLYEFFDHVVDYEEAENELARHYEIVKDCDIAEQFHSTESP